MTIRAATPYLFFNGDASRAIELYTTALGAEVTTVQRYASMPSAEGNLSPEDSDRILHAHLTVGTVALMVSDRPKRMEVPADQIDRSNVQISLDLDDEAETMSRFSALAEGGRVVMPVGDAFWGGKFGMLVDRFGIHWMFQHTRPAT